ncbi:MAG: hypothetical protein F6K22_09440 [Okeania sp. SIO2F4]|uniref:hypothetical protein n=1 Tax=Okeania sp. SIO2F4 TaxID=2607790 RepID=UPI00142B6500|nr:hypothetical protein [Okeania sp. SIO2F4]NES03055.1 hypothetical protein [Okeania sp. SIO2F4]
MVDSATISLANNAINSQLEPVANKLRQLGIPGLESVLEEGKFNIHNMVVNDVKSQVIPVHCKLAASFGKLTKDSFKSMDEELKILLGATVKELQKTPCDQLSWDQVISIFSQNALMERMHDSEIHKSDKLIKNLGTSAFNTDGSPDPAIVEEVHGWFKKLLNNDQDILNDTKIDIDMLAMIVAQSGATINSFESFFAKDEYHKRKVVDIGILRFPDIDHPFVKVYRIQLTAWSHSSRVLFVQHDSNGITGEFNAIQYKPRESVIGKLKQETIEKATAEAESLFD